MRQVMTETQVCFVHVGMRLLVRRLERASG
jgi:hypothetical protein